MLQDTLTFYSQPGPITEAYTYSPLLADLPREIPNLVKAIQGLIVHIFWAERYGLHLSEERQQEVQACKSPRSGWYGQIDYFVDREALRASRSTNINLG
jgi:hypothetical protein